MTDNASRQLREEDYDPCECGHIRWQHTRRDCKGLDSYVCPCRCNGFEINLGSLDVPRDIVYALGQVYKPNGVLLWLRARNRNLRDFKPVELFARGEDDKVRAEVERLVGGAW